MKRIGLIFSLMLLAAAAAQGAVPGQETWDNGNANGWEGNTTAVSLIEARSSGGNPGGWLFTSGTGAGTFDVGAHTLRSNFTGDYHSFPIRRVSVDISLLKGDFDGAWIRFRYKDASYNGWLFPLGIAIQSQGWQTFSVNFDPAWSDEAARKAGWVTDHDVFGGTTNPSESFAVTMGHVYTAEVRLSGEKYLEAGIDNFKISGPPIAEDHFEPNNEFVKSVDIGTFSQNRSQLSIHNASDEDWYQWNAISDGDLTIDLKFLHKEGDLQMEVYNAKKELLAASTSSDDNERIEINVLADEKYFIRVYANGLAVSAAYEYAIEFGDPENYAVLFAGGIRIAKNFPRYYNNVKNLYEHLVNDRDLKPENIYVLYADGTDDSDDLTSGNTTSNSDMTYAENVMAGTGANLEDVLVNVLSPIIDRNDHFFFWTFDHGGGTSNAPGTTDEEVLSGWGDSISDEDLEEWLDTIDAGRTTYVFGQCFAGGMLDNLEPLNSFMHGSAATNHYESSYGDGFVAAYLTGLLLHNNTHDVYQYAYEHDGYATDGEGPDGNYANGVEHPWESTSTNFPIFYHRENLLPWIDELRWIRLREIFDPTPIIIPHSLLLGAAVAGDPEQMGLSFRIESVDAGVLLKNGEPVVPGKTIVGPGETLEFLPLAAFSSNSNSSIDLNSVQPLNAFSVRVFDGITVSDERVYVPLLFSDSNDWEAVDDAIIINEDSVNVQVDVLSNDKGQTPIKVVSVGTATHGMVRLEDNQVVYSPAAELSGADSFIYFMADGSGNTDWATVSVQIEAVNDPPEAHMDKFSVLVDSIDNLIDVLDNDFDPESKPISYSIAQSGPYPIAADITSWPANGDLRPTNDGRFLYTPMAGYIGQDSFTYQASDGEALSDVTEVTIDVSYCPEPCIDLDGDGYGQELDCDDSDPGINPAAIEVCDGKDNNCDGQTDESGYMFSQFGQPINPDGSTIIKAGQTIPVKISLTDCSSAVVSTAILEISVEKVPDGVTGSIEETVDDAGNSNSSGTVFRYDQEDQQYIYNLKTKGMESSSTYQITATAENGQKASVEFSVK